MRTNVRLIGLASAVSTLLVPAFVVGLAKLTKASAITVATGHGRLAGVFTQPVAGLQESVVQTVPSLQLRGGPPMHWPPEHVSAVVQALPSSHVEVLFVFTQPVAGLQVSVVQTLPSLQLGAGPPTQTPPAHVSGVVQALPSLQGAVFGVPPAQAPAPSHVLPEMQTLLAQPWPAGSNWQVGEQQSPATRLPSSHCSPRSRTPLPQTCAILPMMVLNWSVCCPPGGNPGPTIRKMFVAQGLPVMVWLAAGFPTRPAGAGGATAVRNGPTRPLTIDCENARFGPAAETGTRGLSCVKLTVPRVSAWRTSTP